MLQISVPDANNQKALDGAPKPADLKNFLTSLPMGAPQAAIRTLLVTIRSYNHSTLDPALRFRIADTISPIARECANILADKYQHSGIPLSDQRYTWHQDVQHMYKEMALAYEIVAFQLSQLSNRPEADGHLLNHSIRKAIVWLARAVLNAYSAYLSDPAEVWRDLHKLYAYAEEQGIENLVLEKSETKQNAVITIQHAYQRIALLAVANPHHLMQGESQLVFNYLNNWAVGCHISRLTDTLVPAGTLLIDLTSERAPYFTHRKEEVNIDTTRSIDTTRLINRFNQVLSKYTREQNGLSYKKFSFNERLHRNMLLRLQTVWKGRPQRKASRRPNTDKVILAAGLSASNYYIGGEMEFLPEIDEIRCHRPQDSGSGLSLMPKEYEPWRHEEEQSYIASGVENTRISNFSEEASIWNKIYANKTQGRMLREEVSYYFSKNEWSLFNAVEEGLGVTCLNPAANRTRVGDIVCYHMVEETGQWKLGEVRWMRDLRDFGVTMGIKKMAESAQQVAVRAVAGAGSGGEYFRALIVTTEEGAILLITPSAIYDVDTQLVINRGDQLEYVCLTRMVDTTSSFSRFEFKTIDIPTQEAALIAELKNS
jgi:hypothetical protein